MPPLNFLKVPQTPLLAVEHTSQFCIAARRTVREDAFDAMLKVPGLDGGYGLSAADSMLDG